MSAPLKRNWAKGQRLEFLSSHIDGYLEARRQGQSTGSEYMDTVVNSYFNRFPWNLSISEDPPSTSPCGPNALLDENLTDAELKQKGEVIARMRTSIYGWFDYRIKKIDKTLIRGNQANDLFALLLGSLTSQGKRPAKLLAGWQHWSKTHFDLHKAEFEEQFKQSGADEKQRASARQTYTRKLFSSLPAETQELHNRLAGEEHAAALRQFEEKKTAPISTDPADRQAAIDRLGTFAGPILEGISKATGLHASLLVGGPEPCNGGQINVISMHEGVNKAAVPKNWKTADKKEFKTVTKLFTKYLEGCYTKSERDARAMPNVNAASRMALEDDNDSADEDDKDDDDAPPEPASAVARKRSRAPRGSAKSTRGKPLAKRARTARNDPDAEFVTSSGESRGASPGPSRHDVVVMANGKKIRGLPFQARPLRSILQTTTSTSLKARRPRPQPVRAANPALATNSSIVSEGAVAVSMASIPSTTDTPPEPTPPAVSPAVSALDQGGDNDGSDSNHGNDDTDAAPLHVSAPKRKSLPEECPESSEGQGSAKRAHNAEAAEVSDAAFSPRTADDVVEVAPPVTNTTTPPVVASYAPPVAATILSTLPATDVHTLTPVTTEATSEAASESWPTWFKSSFSGLKAAELGPRWDSLLDCYVKHEASSEFDNPKGTNRALSAKNRPTEVDWWIARARKPHPTVKDPAALGAAFWIWWKGLQPSWREASDVSGPLTSTHRDVKGDWAVLDKPGQNGFLSVIAVLGWWGRALVLEEKSTVPTNPDWLSACEDVEWVLRRMLPTPSPQ